MFRPSVCRMKLFKLSICLCANVTTAKLSLISSWRFKHINKSLRNDKTLHSLMCVGVCLTLPLLVHIVFGVGTLLFTVTEWTWSTRNSQLTVQLEIRHGFFASGKGATSRLQAGRPANFSGKAAAVMTNNNDYVVRSTFTVLSKAIHLCTTHVSGDLWLSTTLQQAL